MDTTNSYIQPLNATHSAPEPRLFSSLDTRLLFRDVMALEAAPDAASEQVALLALGRTVFRLLFRVGLQGLVWRGVG